MPNNEAIAETKGENDSDLVTYLKNLLLDAMPVVHDAH
jgi:hypothetical protein